MFRGKGGEKVARLTRCQGTVNFPTKMAETDRRLVELIVIHPQILMHVSPGQLLSREEGREMATTYAAYWRIPSSRKVNSRLSTRLYISPNQCFKNKGGVTLQNSSVPLHRRITQLVIYYPKKAPLRTVQHFLIS